MSTSKTWIALSALIGALAAVATTAVIHRIEAKASSPTQAAASTVSGGESVRTVIVESSSNRLDTLQEEIAQLKRERQQAPAAPSEAQPRMTVEEERRHLEQRFSELDRRHESDPVDPQWSRSAGRNLQNDLAATGTQAGFTVVAAECKTEMCRATMRWENYESATKSGMQLPERAIPGLNCTKSIWLKEPADVNVPYTANLYLECADQRAGRVDEIPGQSQINP